MIGGAVVAEGLKQLIAEAKKFKNFKPQNLDAGELKGLMERIEKAKIVVRKCQDVPFLKEIFGHKRNRASQ